MTLTQGAVPQWRDISTAPKDGMEMLAWSACGYAEVWSAEQYHRSISDGASPALPREEAAMLTHWMPLPPPPEQP